jgi:hypothetical protein
MKSYIQLIPNPTVLQDKFNEILKTALLFGSYSDSICCLPIVRDLLLPIVNEIDSEVSLENLIATTSSSGRRGRSGSVYDLNRDIFDVFASCLVKICA